ncbi:uncharacterized protein RSE6_07410 [Rhynchosporium secalis]|uniref:Uncharacterized protein n=1 Tax=Rhynchosporium secalis TaxID=38038 RepID=A0A1E1MCR7_RHYSE|nr:uncharacterized protein RSE6_07410 [Rhynchosporium secalis]
MARGPPKLNVLVEPRFDENGHAISLHISLTFDCRGLRRDSTLLTSPASLLEMGDGIQLHASDESGELLIILDDLKESRQSLQKQWLTTRETFGSVKVHYEVRPSQEDEFKYGRPVIGLHKEPGGLLGSGFAILPILPAGNAYTNTVEWKLTGAPNGTRAVWTYGEGPEPVARVGPVSVLRNSVFMVGQIQSNPRVAVESSTANVEEGHEGSTSDTYGYYWFGLLPPKIAIMKNIHYACFTNAQKMFGPDDDSVQDFKHAFFVNVPEADRVCIVDPLPYRSFIRNTRTTKAFGGTSFAHSHIFDYDDQIDKVNDFDVVRQVAYEMAQIWFGLPALEGYDWFFEGIMNCLSIYIPVRHLELRNDYYISRFCGKPRFALFADINTIRGYQCYLPLLTAWCTDSTVNMLCTRYYTSPLIKVPFKDVLKMTSTDALAREHMSARAWAFVFGVDMRARILAKHELKTAYPVERIAMLALANHKARDDAHTIKYWMKLLTPVMGKELKQRYVDFCDGVPIVLPEGLIGFNSQLRSFKDNVLDFGMNRESFSAGVVKGLQVGSRAWVAKLENGDKILWSSHEWRCVDSSDEKYAYMVLDIERDGKLRKIKYLPRSFDEVDSWELRMAKVME